MKGESGCDGKEWKRTAIRHGKGTVRARGGDSLHATLAAFIRKAGRSVTSQGCQNSALWRVLEVRATFAREWC
jgi:hypothetical protein